MSSLRDVNVILLSLPWKIHSKFKTESEPISVQIPDANILNWCWKLLLYKHLVYWLHI